MLKDMQDSHLSTLPASHNVLCLNPGGILRALHSSRPFPTALPIEWYLAAHWPSSPLRQFGRIGTPCHYPHNQKLAFSPISSSDLRNAFQTMGMRIV